MFQIEQELDWQPHTIRSAISRLRKSGKNIATGKTSTRVTAYQIVI
ncbi:MAG: DUF3489 domain-containing protein [Rhizobiaceae bacterium]|nr:DUF3489 domain-containing protein [Rhizobiaceae bacterium]